jgi:hypothetical protein
LSSEQATKLLDDLIYERVLSFIDLDGLFGFEQELWCAYEELGPGGDHVAVAAKTMIDRALVRLCEDPRRYMTFGEPYGGSPLGSSPLGTSPLSASRRGTSPLDVIPYGNELFADCELCEQEARELREDDARAAGSAKRRRTS